MTHAGTSIAGAFLLPLGASNATDGWKVGKLLKIVGKSLGDVPLQLFTAGVPPAGGVDSSR